MRLKLVFGARWHSTPLSQDTTIQITKKLVLVKQLFSDVFVIRKFESIEAVVKAGLTNNRGTVTRRLNVSGPKWRTWVRLGKVS